MARYEYKCTACNTLHEVHQKMNDPQLEVCPSCGKKALEKQISKNVHIQFVGSGFYATEYAPKKPCCGKCGDSCKHH
jgi:putative FmdB family regulatory protein